MSTPRSSRTPVKRGAESPAQFEGQRRQRRISGGRRVSPGPGIYRTMPLSSPANGRTTPSHLVRPIPQHLGPTSVTSPNPFSPITVPKITHSPAMSPVPFSPITVQRYSGSIYDYGGQENPTSSVSQTTADIIACQSQDYVDEQLAEFQEQILRLQDEQERVQKKTFVNWINSYLSKHSPSMSIVDLIEDLKDGSKLLALLEVLSGESLPVEKGRLLKRPHFLSNCNTALEFLKSKRIKLVNINASDLVDGRPPVVLGLIWTIILYFQIEENTRVLEKLGQRYGSPYAEYRPRSQIGYSTDDSSDDRASRKVNEKWKAGAKRALLQWCQSHVTKKSGVPIQDFGRSWRDGNAFLGMINGIKPGVVDIKSMAKENNKTRLETAFYAAESKLGIARLLDPEDVDVENPDEKSVMTYVAQFLHRYPEGEEVEFRERFTSVESQFSELRQWLRTKIQLFDTVHQGKTKPNFMRNFSDYEKFKMEVREKKVVYDRLRQVMESNNKIIGIDSDAWKEVDMNWQKIQAQVRHWQWLLDTALPGEFGQVGEWLNQAEALVYGDDVPTVLNEEAATLLNQKIEEHKNFFSHLHSVKKQFEEALNFSPLVHEISEGQINSINMRLQGIGPLSEVRAVKLRFLEHKCCIVAFLVLTESRLKNWTIKYGKEDKVQQIIHQYRTFISKNKVFHEFEKAFQEFEQVCLEYKEHGNIDQEEADQIGRFIREIAKRWKDTSTELRCVQSLLEEVLTYWKRWNTLAPEFRRYLNTGFEVLHKGDEDQRQNFFYDVSAWRDKHSSLQDTVAFLIATCDPSVGKELSDELNAMSTDWERLYNSGGKDYVHGSDINRIKQDYDEGLESLDRWLRRAENLLSQKQSLNFASEVKSSLDSMMALHAEIVPMEDVFKNISKKFQLLARELSQDDIKKMMFVLKKEKENLVIVRSMIPSKLQLFHHLFTQLEAIDENERKIVEWCEATNQLLDMPSAKSSKEFMTRSEKIKRAVSSVTSLQGSLQSLKNVFQGVLKNVENKDDFEVSKLKNRIATVVDTFGSTVDRLKDFEMKILKENEALEDFREVQKCAEAWIVEGESLMLVRNFESKETVLKHKEFFGHPKNDELMKRFLQSASNLKPYLHSAEEKEEISQKVEEIKSKWKDISERAPLHLAKAKFRLVEETLEKHLKEIEKYIADESLAFQRGDHHEIEDIIKNHNEYFEFNPVVQEAKKCLDQLQALSSCKEAQGNAELKKNYEIRNQQWAVLMEKHMKFSSFLEQVPEQWNEYESKFDQMTNWMNSVDLALEKIFREEPTPEGFNLEKEKFELLCNDIDSKREDMKWLVQSLNQLMSNRPNEEGLSEQNRLEKLVTRYKSIIPLIDTTRQKIDAFTKSYLFKNDVQEVMDMLDNVTKRSLASLPEQFFHENCDIEVQNLIIEQEACIHKLEEYRSPILKLLQQGKDLQKNLNCPGFLKDLVKELELRWNSAYSLTVDRLKHLKDSSRIWSLYQQKKENILKMIEATEGEFKKVIPKQDHKTIVDDLKTKIALKDDVKTTTAGLISKMKVIVNELDSVFSVKVKDHLNSEILEMEKNLKNLFLECDVKINHLQDIDTKWKIFNKNFGEMKNWTLKAKIKLSQITKSDISLEDRMKLIVELKDEIQGKAIALEGFEVDFSDFFKSLSAKTGEVCSLKNEVESVKKDVEDLKKDIDKQTIDVQKGLEHWKDYRTEISKEIKPWIEGAELKIAVGLPRPRDIKEVEFLRQDINSFRTECTPIKEKIDKSLHKVAKIEFKTSAEDEVDALMSKLQAVKSTLYQWDNKMESIENAWKNFDDQIVFLNSWIREKESLLEEFEEVSSLNPQKINEILRKVKEMAGAIHEKQSNLLNLSQECDLVCLQLNPEGAIELKNILSNAKLKMTKLGESNRVLSTKIHDVFNKIQDYSYNVDEFQAWLKRLEVRINELNEIPVENINSALDTTHDISQEHLDKKCDLDKIKMLLDSEVLCSKNFALENYDALKSKYDSLENLLALKKSALQRWANFWTWHAESISALQHLQHTTHKTSSPEELELAGGELDNLAVQCQTRKSECSDDEEIAANSKTYIIQAGKPMSILLLVADILQKIVDLKKNFGEKEQQLHELDDKWEDFKQAEQNIANWLQTVLQQVQKIAIKESTIDSLKEAATQVTELIKSCTQNNSLRETYHAIGNELMALDSSRMQVLQDALSEGDSKWEKVVNLLHEQESKSKTLIGMWEQCNELEGSLKEQLDKCEDAYDALVTKIPTNVESASLILDSSKSAIDDLKKARHPFEVYYKKQTQLIQELQTVPSFDVSTLKKELQGVQQKFSFLGTNIKDKLNKSDSLLVIWKQIHQNKKEFNHWTKDTQNSFTESLANISDVESARAKLNKFELDLPQFNALKNAGIFTKLDQIVELTDHGVERIKSTVVELKDSLDKDLEVTQNIAKDLNRALGDVDDCSEQMKKNILDCLNWLSTLRERTLKFDDLSGKDQDLLTRLDNMKEISTELESFDNKFVVIEEGIKNLQNKYNCSKVNNLFRDLGNLEKKYDSLFSQISKISGSLFGLLEKRYSDKVQDLLKSINLNEDKVSWCSPEPDSDKFALNSKLETLSEVRQALIKLKESNKDLEISSNVLLKTVSQDKAVEIKETVVCLGQRVIEFEETIKKVNTSLNERINLFNKYETEVEEALSWIHEKEDALKNELVADLDSSSKASEEYDDVKKDINAFESKIKEIVGISEEILENHPASRVGSTTSQLQVRFEALKGNVDERLCTIQELIKNQSIQKSFIEAFEKWLRESKRKLSPFEDIDHLKSKEMTVQKLMELKLVVAEKDRGHQLLERAISEGENLFSYIPNKDREVIRRQIRAMRDNWENHIDYMNSIQKNISGLAMQWTSFDESFDQVKHWLEASNKKLKNADKLCSDLSAKKAVLAEIKILDQDVLSHYTILENMKCKSKELNNPMALDAQKASEKEYNALKSVVRQKLNEWNMYVFEHEAYRAELEKMADFINNFEKDFIVLSVSVSSGTPQMEKNMKIETLDGIISSDFSIREGLNGVKAKLWAILEHTSPDGKESLKREFEDLIKKWTEITAGTESLKEKIMANSIKIAGIKEGLNMLNDWLAQIENKIKNQSSLKDNAEEKQEHLDALESFQKCISDKADEFKKITSADVDGEIMHQSAGLNARYHTLKKNVKDLIIKYEVFVKEHNSFDEKYNGFIEWIRCLKEDLSSFGEVIGDLKVLQERKANIEELEDLKNNENLKYDSISELGEKLYSHTSASGKEKIRNQLKNLRSQWEELNLNFQLSTTTLDKCLQQFSDFTALQERLTKWLKDIERAMQEHTELKSSLQEKRGQLQNHLIVHQEITSHNSLVDSVCSKAQELVDQTQDKTLNAYIQSIKLLFRNIGLKSKDLMDKLQCCVADHENYTIEFKNFAEFYSYQSERLAECGDVMGEKSELDRRISLLKELKDNKIKGNKELKELESLCLHVCKSTAPKGCDYLRDELNQIKESWNTHETLLEELEINIEKAKGQWNQFHSDMDKHLCWFKKYESFFKEQYHANDLTGKEKRLEFYVENRNSIIDYERIIDDFVNSAHALIQNTGTERLKPAITQISNRYQLLHVLSKEVVSKWQSLVEDHQSFEIKIEELKNWFKGLEDKIDAALKESNIEIKSKLIQGVLVEEENTLCMLNYIYNSGERLYPDTGALGREKIRQTLKDFRSQWDIIVDRAHNLQKKQDVQLRAWINYQESLEQAQQWLDLTFAECGGQKQLEGINWLSPQEARSRLLKIKTSLQDVTSHKRLIEIANEKGAAVVATNPHASVDEIQVEIEKINEKYEELLETVKSLIQDVEDALESIQTYQDMQKKHIEWQKNMWDRLSMYTDYSGNKAVLDSRLKKVREMEDRRIAEESDALSKMTQIASNLGNSQKMSSWKIKDELERDLSNIHFDFQKFTSSLKDVRRGLLDRLNQWNEYGSQLEKLLSWLCEAEVSIKSYSPKATLQEKTDQLNSFLDAKKIIDSKGIAINEFTALTDQLEQSVICGLRHCESDVDPFSDEASSDISSQIGGDFSHVSMNVQQIASRFQSLCNTQKDLIKKCERAIVDHKAFHDKYDSLSQGLSDTEAKFRKLSFVNDNEIHNNNKEEVCNKLQVLEDLLSEKHIVMSNLNTTIEFGEKLYSSTSPEGRECIRKQINDVQRQTEELFGQISQDDRTFRGILSKWTGYEESSSNFIKWINYFEESLQGDIILKTTLDEKKAQLLTYRNLFQEIKSQKPVLDDLKEKSASLPEKSEGVSEFIKNAIKKHDDLFVKVKSFVDAYEAIVIDHQQYTKAVIENSEWLAATNNTLEMLGDNSLERLSLHANLERLKNIQLTLPDEKHRFNLITTLGEKVIPGTIDVGQVNIRSQIDMTVQEWEGLKYHLQSIIESLEAKISQWTEFEKMKEVCLVWLRDTDTLLHTFDLKCTLEQKKSQLEELKKLQSLICAKELEIDAVTDKAQDLYKSIHNLRNSHLTELSIKYQNITSKVKDLIMKWQSYVTVHEEYQSKLEDSKDWMKKLSTELDKVTDMSISSHSDIDNKVLTLNYLILSKDEGYAKIQMAVETAQSVLANTASSGHEVIKKEMEEIQGRWSDLTSRMAEMRLSIDGSIQKWAGFIDLISELNNSMDVIQENFDEIVATPLFKSSSENHRTRMNKLKTLEDKMKCFNNDKNNLKTKIKELAIYGNAASDADEAFKRHDKLFRLIGDTLVEYESQLKDFRAYRIAMEALTQYLQRCRDKIHTMKQRSPNDKNYVDAVTQALDHLLNKEAQGQIMTEQLQQSVDVLSANSSEEEGYGAKEATKIIKEFTELFEDIKCQRDQMSKIMNVFRDFKEETERLSDWLQQVDINIKAAKTCLLLNLEEKEKAVRDMSELNDKLMNGQKEISKYSDMASKMKDSCLEVNVNTQLKEICNKYQATRNTATNVLRKIESIYEQHYQYEKNMISARNWMDKAWSIIRSNANSEGKSKEDLHRQLDEIRRLIHDQEEGQQLVHGAIDWGEKAVRNTRSDGREKINQCIKDLQNDWEKLTKKMSTAKVSVETDLLQWSDAQQSVSKLKEWIKDRESRLQQVSQQKHVMITRRSTLGITTLSVSERTATLRQTNSILQDIRAFEPMIIQTVTNSSNEGSPASEIASKYQDLTNKAQQLYDTEKEMVDRHEHFMVAGNEFMNWLRIAKEKLSKCSEPTGDKESLAGKISQLKVLESEKKTGENILGEALKTASSACEVALEDDRIIVEEEVAFLQDEFDQFSESLQKVKSNLEGGIVQWTDYQDMYKEALEYLESTQISVQSFNKLQSNLQNKRKILEDFQLELQKIFDWQKSLDLLNVKGQSLLETCADSRVSNAITQLTTKYQALLSLAKEVMRSLERYFQEHHQHNAIIQDCQSFMDQTREKLNETMKAPNTHKGITEKLKTVNEIKDGFDLGQNKLRYVLELKDKVISNTESDGAKKIESETEELKKDFEKLISEIQDAKQNLNSKFHNLEDFEKSSDLLNEWIGEMELKGLDNLVKLFTDLGEKRANYEKYKQIFKDIESYALLAQKLRQAVDEEPNPFEETLHRFDGISSTVEKNTQILDNHVTAHEDYKLAFDKTCNWIKKIKLELQEFGDPQGIKDSCLLKLEKLNVCIESLREGEDLLKSVVSDKSCLVLETTNEEGKDSIKQDNYQLKYDYDQVRNSAKQCKKNMDKCASAWCDFELAHDNMRKWIDEFTLRVESECKSDENFDVVDLERRRELLKAANQQKYEMENLNDKCEILMEYSACPYVRDLTVKIQTDYTNCYTLIQSLLSKAEKTVTDHSEFYKAKENFDDWYERALGTVNDSSSLTGDPEVLKEKLESLKSVTSRMTEGQHLLNRTSESYAKQNSSAPLDKRESMKEILINLKNKYDNLSVDLTKYISEMGSAHQRWMDFDNCYINLKSWAEDVVKSRLPCWENLFDSSSTSKPGEMGEMKINLEKCNALLSEIEEKNSELNGSIKEAIHLSGSQQIFDRNDELKETLNFIKSRCQKIKDSIEDDIKEHKDYYQSIQDTEKWLLQVSFQLMAHNSLYITTKDQTNEQLTQHSKLLENIINYQSTLDAVREKGIRQITKYSHQCPNLQTTIEKQEENVQDSYESLLQTAIEIKNRLEDSLVKFQEYEDTLSSIMENLNDWEIQIKEEILKDDAYPDGQLEALRGFHNRLQAEKSRLSMAIQICEAASASISRPASPLQENKGHKLPEKEFIVKAKLEELIDQVQTSMSALGSQVQEINDLQKEKESLDAWISNQENLVAEMFKKSAKYRSDAAQTEIQSIINLRQSLVEKQAVIDDIELRQSVSPNYIPDHNSKIALDTLDEHIGMLLDKKNNQFLMMEDYRSAVSESQAWFEMISKSIEDLEVGSGITGEIKLKKVKEIEKEYDLNKDRPSLIKEKANTIIKEVGDMDCQHIEEQSCSIQRRMVELQKRINRKKQIIYMALEGYNDTDSNIVVVKDWLESNIEYVNESQKNLPSDVSNLQKYISSLTSLSKEVDSKVLYIDNLENKLNTIKADLEPEESVHLAQKLSSLRDKKKVLAKLLQDGLNRTSIYVQEKVDFDTNSENIKTLLNSMSSEFQTCAEWNPLKSHSVEKRIVKLKKIESEVKELEETEVSKLNRSVLSLSKSGSSENIQKTVKEIQDSLKSLKSQIKDKIVSMETLIEPRKGFEADLEMCFNWLNKSETGISSEIRGTPNVAVLEQHLSKFKDVKGEEEPYRKNISKLLAYGNSILPTLSDSDRLTLQSKLDELCDRLNQVVEALNKKMEDLVESIDRYRAATSKIEVNVAQLSKVQSEILALNKPIGYKIEDAESVYRAYEKILEDLRKFKAQIEELNRTSGANVYELRSILQQQEELILSIENQMTRMKGLIITRQQYSSLVTGLTEFIINYTEIVKEIERSNIQPSEKVKRYDEAISKITDSEAQLAMASDKGQLIASEGSVQDRNQVMDQLQSLKNQVHSLKKAIQKKREEHVQSASETKKLVEEIEAVLEKLRNRETPVQSRPILTSAVANVEEKIIEHDSLVNEVKTYLSKLKDLCDSAQALGEESSLCSVRSSALALLHSIPLELDERRVYLEDNKTYRLSYDNAVQRLNTWIEEAQMKLRLYVDGVDFENLENELDEHKKYFGQETKLRDLLNQISENAGKIRPSLSPQCQEKLSHEEKFFNQLVKNTLNSALSQQGIIEKNCRMWRVFQRFLKDEDFNFDDHSAPDRINCLPSLKKSIIKLQPEIDKLEEKRLKLDKLKENAKSVQKVADVLNRNKIDKELSAIEEAFRNKLTRLKEKKENATALVVQWEDFESKHKNFEALLNKLISQLTSGDVTFRSFEQMISMRSSLNKLKEDARISDSKRKDVLVLSSNVLTMLNEYPSSSCKSEIEDRVTSVSKKYNKLLEDIDNKLKMINEEIQSIEEADKKSDELGNKLFKLNNDIQKIDIWTQDEDCETHLLNYKGQVDSTFAEAQNLNSNLRRKYQEFGQSLPADISEKLSGLEISFENLHSQLDEKLRDLKRARSIRSGFIGDVEVIQSWIQSAEAKINNRSGDPQSLKERVQEAFSELSEMANRTENLNKNGNILINKTKNPSEKDLIISTVDNLTEQMTQVRHVIEEKKIAANEAIDSWFKFFQLYENVIGWCGEKKAILKEPLKFNNLSQELQEFLNAKKSLKYISKDIQEMNRELVKINNICDSEDLGDKLNEAEALKTETEAHLTERTAMIQELTEEWDQCERKLKEIEVWIGDCQKTLNSIQNKKRPIREQFALRERATGDVTIARTKISMAMEKLKVHFREENMSDNDIVERVSILEKKLNGLESVLKEENVVLGSSLNQLEAYHADVSRLRQRIITEEQSLRTVMNPAYVSKNKDKALTEQASCRERIRNIQSKITAFNERIKLINQRATPDPTPLKYDFPH